SRITPNKLCASALRGCVPSTFLTAASASSRRPAWTSAPASLNSVSIDGRCVVPTTEKATRQTRIRQRKTITSLTHKEAQNAQTKIVCASCAFFVAYFLKDELEGELHLPAALFADIASKIV